MNEEQRKAKLAELAKKIKEQVTIVDGKPVEKCDDIFRDFCITLDQFRGVWRTLYLDSKEYAFLLEFDSSGETTPPANGQEGETTPTKS